MAQNSILRGATVFWHYSLRIYGQHKDSVSIRNHRAIDPVEEQMADMPRRIGKAIRYLITFVSLNVRTSYTRISALRGRSGGVPSGFVTTSIRLASLSTSITCIRNHTPRR